MIVKDQGTRGGMSPKRRLDPSPSKAYNENKVLTNELAINSLLAAIINLLGIHSLLVK